MRQISSGVCRVRAGKWFGIPALFVLLFLSGEIPAQANAIITWGMGREMMLHIAMRGVGLVVVILLEALIIGKICGLKTLPALGISALLNIVSLVLGGLIGLWVFSASFNLALIMLFIIIAIYFLRKLEAPLLYYISPLILYVVMYVWTLDGSSSIGPSGTFRFWAVVYSPIVLGLLLTLIIEGFTGSKLIRSERKWMGIGLANLASYILIALLIPFLLPNPFQDSIFRPPPDFYEVLGDRSESPDLIVDDFRAARASTLELLGFVDESPPPENFDAHIELEYLGQRYMRFLSICDTSIAFAVIDDALTVPTLTDEGRKNLMWFRKHLDYWIEIRALIEKCDQAEFDSVFSQWKEWYKDYPFPSTHSVIPFDDFEEYIIEPVALEVNKSECDLLIDGKPYENYLPEHMRKRGE